jgi:hypothetical protein
MLIKKHFQIKIIKFHGFAFSIPGYISFLIEQVRNKTNEFFISASG